MSATAVVGLLIVSTQTRRVRGPIAASTSARSVVSTARCPIPERSRTEPARPTMPPYTARGMTRSSPVRRIDRITAWMAAMPEAAARPAAAPSSSATAASSAACVGFEYRV